MSDADGTLPTLDEALQTLADDLAVEREAARGRMLVMGMSEQEIEAVTRYGKAMHDAQIALARAKILAKFSPR